MLRATRRFSRAPRKRWADYDVRNRVEVQMNFLKLIGERIMSRAPDRQTAEIQIRIAILSRFAALNGAKIEALA